jgi:hypothetical protein
MPFLLGPALRWRIGSNLMDATSGCYEQKIYGAFPMNMLTIDHVKQG